ncbi:Activity-regulated cytoskeleton associated protein 1, partial [Bienertia sinuspersici]
MNHMIQRIIDRQSVESPHGSNSVGQDLEVLHKAMNGENSPPSGVEHMKLPKSKSFKGNRDSKVLKNFIWDLKHYFKVSRRKDGSKVDIANLYLSGDAKLWWRSRLEADKAMGRDPISTWEEMKATLRKQFLPNNVSWIACDKLHELRHNGSIREYVKHFMSLLLDIDGMPEQDKGSNKRFKRQNKEDSGDKTGKEDEASISKKHKFEGRCFIRKGPHLTRQCSRRQQLSAIHSEENNDERAHDGEDTPPRISNMRLLDAMNAEDAGIDGLMGNPKLHQRIRGKKVGLNNKAYNPYHEGIEFGRRHF